MNIKTTFFKASEADIRIIRDAVFGQEQSVPRNIDWDGEDYACIHIMACTNNGISIGTGRIKSDGKIGRVAILKDFRGQGIGESIDVSN